MVTRKLVFYRWLSMNAKPDFSPHDSAAFLKERIDQDPLFAVLEGEEITSAVNIVQAGDEHSPVRLQLLALRNPEHRPLQWRPGAPLAPLPLLKGQYPADVTHVAIWPDGIAAQDFHGNAPRLGRLSYFLRHKAQSYVSFEPLYRPGMFERLNNLRGQLRSVHMAMTRPEYTHKDRGFFATLVPAAYGAKAPSVNVQLGIGRYGPRDRYLDEATEEAVFSIAEDANDYVNKLIVTGINRQTGRSETVNLLSERLQVEVEILPSGAGEVMPDPTTTFTFLDDAYGDFQGQDLLSQAIHAQLMRG
jgi:hypothetical protein